MSERWFHAVSIPGEGEPVELDPAEGRHATRSRQLENGEEIALSDGAGTAARAILSEGERRRASAVVVERILHPAPPRRLHLASALPKGDRLSTLLSMETQLGMTTSLRWRRAAASSSRAPRRPSVGSASLGRPANRATAPGSRSSIARPLPCRTPGPRRPPASRR